MNFFFLNLFISVILEHFYERRDFGVCCARIIVYTILLISIGVIALFQILSEYMRSPVQS